MDTGQDFIRGDDKQSFREIVLSHLRKILDFNVRVVCSDLEIEHVKAYRDMVLGFSDVLLPFYDEEMEEHYKKNMEDYHNKAMKCVRNGSIINEAKFVSSTKLVTRKLFRELNLLMKRQDYLKGTIYTEEQEETEVGNK